MQLAIAPLTTHWCISRQPIVEAQHCMSPYIKALSAYSLDNGWRRRVDWSIGWGFHNIWLLILPIYPRAQRLGWRSFSRCWKSKSLSTDKAQHHSISVSIRSRTNRRWNEKQTKSIKKLQNFCAWKVWRGYTTSTLLRRNISAFRYLITYSSHERMSCH